MPCFSKTKLVDDVTSVLDAGKSSSTIVKTNNTKYDSMNIKKCKTRVENPNFETRKLPGPIREECIDIMQLRGYSADPTRRILRRPQPPKQSGGNRLKQPKYILKHEMERLRDAAKVETAEERQAKIREEENYNMRMTEMATKTKEHFKTIDEARWNLLAKTGGIDGDSKLEEKNRVLDRSFIVKYEQDPDVKEVNRIIMGTKVAAIRDAQLLEKSIIEKKILDEKLRLEKLAAESSSMESDEKAFLKDRAKKAMYRAEITAQLKERETLRFLESQRLEEEAKQIQLAQEAYKKMEADEKIIAMNRRKRLMDDYNKVLEMTNLFKKMLCEQEQESEMRVAAYLREKKERERQLAEEKRMLKEAFERRQRGIFILAQKVLETKSQQGEMSLLREQERAEREYRRKEKEAAMKKIQYEKELAESREKQKEESKRRRALQIARAEEDFNAMLEKIRQDQLKEEENAKKRKCRRECYRLAIMNQMNDKELERRRLEDQNRQEAFLFLESERQREANINAVINVKLEAIRQACLPEKYVKEIEAQLTRLKNSRRKVT